jgi:hypothetical protein
MVQKEIAVGLSGGKKQLWLLPQYATSSHYHLNLVNHHFIYNAIVVHLKKAIREHQKHKAFKKNNRLTYLLYWETYDATP